MKIRSQIQEMLTGRAQAMVEFALVLMILLVVLVGILEVGRLMFIYAAVNNASREAARYGSAVGLDDSGTYLKYQYCDGIREVARRSAFFTPLTTSIAYDHGPGTGSFDTCDGSVDTGVAVNSGTALDRVRVTVSANYEPMVRLVPISSRTITSSTARTIFGFVDLQGPIASSPNTPTSSATTPAGTSVPSVTSTVTLATSTRTATARVGVVTMTPLPSNTPTLIPTFTPTRTSTPTSTKTSTATLTFTPTPIATAKAGCDSVTSGPILITGNEMSLSIKNPHQPITVLDVQVIWNAVDGGTGNKMLSLKSASLGGVFWAGTDSTGNLTITPPTTVTIPGNNATSTILFTFDRNYQNKNSAESIVINLSTPGCESYPIHKP